MSSITPSLCAACNTLTTVCCSRCKSASYCSRDCQKYDWPVHKLLCATCTSLDSSTQPIPHYFRAILFPVDAEPIVMWLHDWSETDASQHTEEIRSLFEADAPIKGTFLVQNKILGRDLSNKIHIRYCGSFIFDASTENNSVGRVCAAKPGQHLPWAGPFLAFGEVGTGSGPTVGRDLDMNDFRHITDWFLLFGHNCVHRGTLIPIAPMADETMVLFEQTAPRPDDL